MEEAPPEGNLQSEEDSDKVKAARKKIGRVEQIAELSWKEQKSKTSVNAILQQPRFQKHDWKARPPMQVRGYGDTRQQEFGRSR